MGEKPSLEVACPGHPGHAPSRAGRPWHVSVPASRPALRPLVLPCQRRAAPGAAARLCPPAEPQEFAKRLTSFDNIIARLLTTYERKNTAQSAYGMPFFVAKLFIFQRYKRNPVGPLFSYTSFQHCKSDPLSEKLPFVFNNLTEGTSNFAFFIFWIPRCAYKSHKFNEIDFCNFLILKNNLFVFLHIVSDAHPLLYISGPALPIVDPGALFS